MADFLNTGVWVREFATTGTSNIGIDYILNTDHFLQNSASTTATRIYLDTSTSAVDTGTTNINSREIKHIPSTNAFAVAGSINFRFMTSTVTTVMCSPGC
jgi:hypothetical protein